MTKYAIIEKIAKERRVEQMISVICKTSAPELSDLAQIIYLALLEKPEETIAKAYNEGWLGFLMVRMIKNNYFSNHSVFRDLFSKYSRRAVDIEKALDKYEQDYFDKPRCERD